MDVSLLSRIRNGRPRSGRSRIVLVRTAAPLLLAGTLILIVMFPLLFSVGAPNSVAIANVLAIAGRFVGALLLYGFSVQALEPRLRWVAAGLAVSAVGSLIAACLPALGFASTSLPTLLNWSIVRVAAGVLILRGVIPRGIAARSLVPTFAAGVSLLILGSVFTVLRISTLPPEAMLIVPGGVISVATLPSWYWAIVTLPAVLGVLAVAMIVRYPFADELGTWLPVALTLLSTAIIYDLVWPPLGSEALDSADLLRVATSIVIVIGGAWDLQRLARSRAEQLATEREYAQRLASLAEVKARFLSMVAHELASPLGAIRGLAEMLESPALTDAQRRATLASLQAETDILDVLIADVAIAARLEHDDFVVNPRAVPLGRLLAEAEIFARTLPGDHPVAVGPLAEAEVLADPERIGQVLRNLLSNAAKYSSAGAPITLRARIEDRRACIEVADQGFGIHTTDLKQIFDEFGRGQQALATTIPGLGLGLYLSRRIVRAHGGEIRVASTPGVGSVFGFTLEVVR